MFNMRCSICADKLTIYNPSYKERGIVIKLIAKKDKDMSNGMRDMSRTPLTESEIQYIKSEIKRIQADESVFIFNDPEHIQSSTCYNYVEDKVYVTRNVFPDLKYGSAHPRDIMSVGAVLAHEYYGHRTYRDEYMSDREKGVNYHTTEEWQDECRASITAAKSAPGLTQKDKSDLVMDAVYRADEYNHYIEMDGFMKEAVYGYTDEEKNIAYDVRRINYVSKESTKGNEVDRDNNSEMPEVWDNTEDYNFIKR